MQYKLCPKTHTRSTDQSQYEYKGTEQECLTLAHNVFKSRDTTEDHHDGDVDDANEGYNKFSWI